MHIVNSRFRVTDAVLDDEIGLRPIWYPIAVAVTGPPCTHRLNPLRPAAGSPRYRRQSKRDD